MQKITIIIPSHGELRGIEQTVSKFESHPNCNQVAEILVCHNGPILPNSRLERDLGEKVRILHTDEKGLGAGLKLGIENCKSDYLLMTATDLPFEFTDFDQWMALTEPKPDIVIGSKGHKDSQVGSHGPVRLLMSTCYRLLRFFAFPFKYPKDPQGTLFLRTSAVKKTNYQTFSNSFFCTTELIAHMLMHKASWLEVPIVLQPRDGKSSVRIVRDSYDMLKRTIVLGLFIRFRKYVKRNPSFSYR